MLIMLLVFLIRNFLIELKEILYFELEKKRCKRRLGIFIDLFSL